jgi:iron complex outermembrane recepter protein
VYQYNDDIQWFANLSRSIEPAHPWSLIWSGWSRFPSGSGIATGRQDSPIELKPQTANTVEIGGRGDHDWGNWALSYYYAQVKNELLSMQVNQANIPVYIAEINASHTIHQGLELSLHTPIYDFASYGQLSLDQSYTYSHFYYQHDQQLGKNELAGIPPHYYQAKLRFEHPLGYSMALNTEYAAKMPVDYANSRYSDAYHIWGLNFAYTPEHGKWQTWLDLRNVGNQIYATTVTPSYDDQGADAAHFTPSAGFTSYAGVTWKF